MKKLKWRAITVLGLLLLGLFYLTPSLGLPLPSWWAKKQINLGLDLQGGMHLVLGVKYQKAIEEERERIKRLLEERFQNDKVPYRSITSKGDTELVIEFPEAWAQAKGRKIIEEDFTVLDMSGRGGQLTLSLKRDLIQEIRTNSVNQAMETIRNRVDEFGVREPVVHTHGEDRILVQLPGLVDPIRAKGLIGTTAVLEFKLVRDAAPSEEELLRRYNNEVPEGFAIYPEKDKSGAMLGAFLLPQNPEITGAYLIDARLGFDEFRNPMVNFQFNTEGAKRFGRITGENIKKRLAIVLDDVVRSAPVIQSRITDRGQITGQFTIEEAKDLAVILRAGSLPVPVEIQEERTVGPTLGRDSIQQGTIASIVAALLVIFFMMIYYKVSGLIADLALLVNMILILGCLALFRATLTLPGIAGIVLTIGMAVDANIIIFERIREEVRSGKTPRSAVDSGYSKAMFAIIDSNVTTLIAGIVLFQFGTGPVKGFAVTLSIGILSTMYTAIIMTRVIFDYLCLVRRVSRLSI